MDHVFHDEYPFKFIDGPLSLATIASTELSLALWRHKIFNRGITAIDSVLETNFSSIEFFSVPSRIKDIIDEKIISVGEELKKWVKFVSKHNFEFQSVFRANLDDVVFDPNGRISYSKTAAEAIKRNDIGDENKFKVACFFCLEDEIKRLWPSTSRSSEFNNSCVAKKTKPVHYWYCLMTSKEDIISIGNRVWNEFRRQNWASLRYFWQDLNDELKVSMALEIFKHNDIEAMMCLLPKLNEPQAQRVFEAKACEILSILLSNHEYVEHVFALWTHMENVISEGVFLQLIQGLWKLTWNVSRTDCMRRYEVDGILMEIWTRAPDRFRSYVLADSADFFDKLQLQSSGFVFNYGHDMEFLLDLLRNNSAEFRRTVWSKNWKKIVVRAKPSYLKQFLELCLPNDKAIADFKSRSLLDFKLIHGLLIKQGFYPDLVDYLKLCSKTSILMNQKSLRILRDRMGVIISTLLDDKKFENFSSFVDGLFPDTDSATKVKQNLLLYSSSVKSLLNIFNKGRLNDCQQIISRFAISEENLEEMKTKFLDRARKYLTSVQTLEFNVTRWEELLKWCTKNEDEIAAFKKSLDIDAIFMFQLRTYALKSWHLTYRRLSGRLFFYDNFSNWYFDDEQAKRDFKVQKMNTSDGVKAIRGLLNCGPRYAIRRMLNWAFDNDEEEILRFQQKLIIYYKVLSSVLTADDELSD